MNGFMNEGKFFSKSVNWSTCFFTVCRPKFWS